MSAHPPPVILLDPRGVAAAADALAASHAGYPGFRAVFPDPARRASALPAFFRATVADAVRFGAVRAVSDQDVPGRLASVAVWLPPGAFPWSAGRKARATPAFLRVLAADPANFGRFVRYGTRAEQAHQGMAPYWYLVVLGVRPEAQRQGHGTALIEPVLARADRDGVDCRLETADPANVAYYRRFGFEVADPALRLVPGGPTHTSMHRPAARVGPGDRAVR
jgi:ribosomal protein S18 acetylase RimI-like enzyme